MWQKHFLKIRIIGFFELEIVLINKNKMHKRGEKNKSEENYPLFILPFIIYLH
jgi:hypothetical protein